MQINLTGFLNGKNARVFMTDLWELLISAQESSSGIPPKFIEQKKEELKKKMVRDLNCLIIIYLFIFKHLIPSIIQYYYIEV